MTEPAKPADPRQDVQRDLWHLEAPSYWERLFAREAVGTRKREHGDCLGEEELGDSSPEERD